jgi:Ice-binding-like
MRQVASYPISVTGTTPECGGAEVTFSPNNIDKCRSSLGESLATTGITAAIHISHNQEMNTALSKRPSQFHPSPLRPALIASLVLLALPGLALAVPINLGSAGPADWAVLQIGNGSVTIDNTSVSGTSAIWGNTGVGQNEKLSMSGGSLVYGNLFLGNSSTTNFSGGSGVASGFSTFTNQDTLLNTARSDALSAAAAATSLGGTPTTISAGMTLTPGVYSLTNLSLGGSGTLTLSGVGQYVFNISGALNLGGTSQVILTGGATAADVLYNITGTTQAGTSGGSILRGVILAPNASVMIDSGVGTAPHVGLYGEVISGRDITIASGSGIQGVPGNGERPPTVPDAGSTLGLMIMGLGLFASIRPRLASNPSK